MIGSSDNSGGVVVGALVCGTECSGFESRFMLIVFFFSLVEIFLSLVGSLYITGSKSKIAPVYLHTESSLA